MSNEPLLTPRHARLPPKNQQQGRHDEKMEEFYGSNVQWLWLRSKSEIRVHLDFYPISRSKCDEQKIISSTFSFSFSVGWVIRGVTAVEGWRDTEMKLNFLRFEIWGVCTLISIDSIFFYFAISLFLLWLLIGNSRLISIPLFNQNHLMSKTCTDVHDTST